MTASHSASLMLASMRSRRMPALLISTSRRTEGLDGLGDRARSAPAQSLMSSVLATASPPAATISSTTCWAGPASVPSPDAEPPRSFTTTLAPSAASISACSRPMPRPAPVTMTTRPSHSPATIDHSPENVVRRAILAREPVYRPRDRVGPGRGVGAGPTVRRRGPHGRAGSAGPRRRRGRRDGRAGAPGRRAGSRRRDRRGRPRPAPRGRGRSSTPPARSSPPASSTPTPTPTRRSSGIPRSTPSRCTASPRC